MFYFRTDCRSAMLPRMVSIIKDFLETSDQSTEQGKQVQWGSEI